jgi:hypothetical protein
MTIYSRIFFQAHLVLPFDDIASWLSSNGSRHISAGNRDGRDYSFVISEETGHLTVSVSRDGVSVSVFGACTNAEV